MNDTVQSPPVDGPYRAADGGHVPGACNTLGEFVRTVEDGQFDADCYEGIKDLNAKLHEHAWANGGRAKGKVTITFDITQDGGITEIKAGFKIAVPDGKRPKSVLWQTEDHRFTRTRPGQQQLFGIRDAGGPSARVRDA